MLCKKMFEPIPAAARSKAQVYGRSLSAIVGSNPTGAWMFVCCECCVLSGRGLYEGLITRPEESYRLWRVIVCDQETSYARRLQPCQRTAKYKPIMGCSGSREKKKMFGYSYVHLPSIKEYLNLCNKTNKCTSLKYILSHINNIFPFFLDNHQGSFTRLLRIQQTTKLYNWNHSIL